MKQRYYVYEPALLSTYSWASPCAEQFRSCISLHPPQTLGGRSHWPRWSISLESTMPCILLKRRLRLGGLHALLAITEPISGKGRVQIQVQVKWHYTNSWVFIIIFTTKCFLEREEDRLLTPSSWFSGGLFYAQKLWSLNMNPESHKIELHLLFTPGHGCLSSGQILLWPSRPSREMHSFYASSQHGHTHTLHMHFYLKKSIIFKSCEFLMGEVNIELFP